MQRESKRGKILVRNCFESQTQDEVMNKVAKIIAILINRNCCSVSEEREGREELQVQI